jgi:uncharacterized protein YxjI
MRWASAGSRYQRQRLLSIGDDYWIEDEQGRRAFRVDRKALRVRDACQGNIVDHEYEINRDGRAVATVSMRWFRVRDISHRGN